jgi:tetratricopeptide (TPR) repeat protein
VERHTGAYIQWNAGEYPSVDKAGIKSSVILELINRIERNGVEVVIKDFSGILGIPALGTILLDKKNRDNIGQAIGVSPDREKALIRAITGSILAPQMPLEKNLKNSSGAYYFDTFADAEFLLNGKTINSCDVPDFGSHDIKKEIEHMVQILGSRGHDPVAVDMTDPGLGIPVAWIYLKNAFLSYATTSLLFQMSMIYFKRGMYELTIEKLEKALASDTDDAGVINFHLGMCYKEIKEYGKAIEIFKKAIHFRIRRVGSEDSAKEINRLKMASEIFENLEELYTRRSGSEDDIGAGLNSVGELGCVYLNIGICYYKIEDYENAVWYLNKAKDIDSEKNDVYLHLASCYRNQWRYIEALSHYEKALGLTPPEDRDATASISYYIGLCHISLDNFAAGIEYLKKAEELTGGYRTVFLNLGICYRETGDRENSLKYLTKSLEMVPSGKMAAAMEMSPAEHKEEEANIHFQLGLFYSDGNDYSSALKHFKTARELGMDSVEINFNIGISYENMYNYKEAINTYNRSLGLYTENKDRAGTSVKQLATLHFQLSICYLKIGDVGKSIEEANSSIEINPSEIDNYNLLGSIYRQAGDCGKGIEAVKLGLKKGRVKWNSYNLLGVLYRDAGDLENSEKSLKEAIKLAPSEWSNYNILGNVYMAENMPAQAIFMFEKALGLGPGKDYENKIRRVLDEALNKVKNM